MNEREFCYWLQGLIEIGGVRPLEAREVQIVADHLALVFKKVTPEYKAPLDSMIPRHWQQYPKTTCEPLTSGTPKNLVAIC